MAVAPLFPTEGAARPGCSHSNRASCRRCVKRPHGPFSRHPVQGRFGCPLELVTVYLPEESSLPPSDVNRYVSGGSGSGFPRTAGGCSAHGNVLLLALAGLRGSKTQLTCLPARLRPVWYLLMIFHHLELLLLLYCVSLSLCTVTVCVLFSSSCVLSPKLFPHPFGFLQVR